MRMKKRAALLTAGMMIIMSGCSIGKTDITFTTGLSEKEIFQIGDDTVTAAQAKVYLCNYQNLYGRIYDIDLWEEKFQTKSLEQYVKDVTISQMSRVSCMDQLAEQKGVTLTGGEKDELKDAAKEYYDSLNDAEKKYMSVNQSGIQTLYENYALAQKVYASLTTGVNEEVSDDEARVMDALQIVVKDKTKADAVAAQLAGGKDFLAAATDCNEASAIEIIVARDELPKVVEDAAFNLDNEQVSPCIETENGYYFIKCVNKYNEELTDQNKLTIVKKREKEAFNDEYDTFIAGLDSYLNQEVWNSLELETDGEITTDSFFAVFDKYYAPPDVEK